MFLFLQYSGTALHEAAIVGNNNIITYLIDHGAGVNNVTTPVSYHYNIVYYCTTSFFKGGYVCFLVFILVWEVILIEE